MKGMYNGTPQIYGAELPQLLTEFLHKNSKADVLKRHLTGNGSINIFPPGESVRVQEKLRGARLSHLFKHFLQRVGPVEEEHQHGNVYLGWMFH